MPSNRRSGKKKDDILNDFSDQHGQSRRRTLVTSSPHPPPDRLGNSSLGRPGDGPRNSSLPDMPSPARTMHEPEMVPAQGGSSNSSDFVRKLYKMIEDPDDTDIVRWGNDGDTFVVVECEKFTKSILPKHFKHSNFASFVRQLNKYDFHKVRRGDDGNSPYGPNAWEFKHPEFKADKKENLDSIRRKAPAPRKNQTLEETLNAQQHQITLMTESLFAMGQQIEQLQGSYNNLTQANKLLVGELVILQRMLEAQKQAQFEMLSHLENGVGSPTPGRTPNQMSRVNSFENKDTDLRRARELLSSVSPNAVVDRQLEKIQGSYTSPGGSPRTVYPASVGASGVAPDTADSPNYTVYPMGRVVGIDPFHADHINKIPYTQPPAPYSKPEAVSSQPTAAAREGSGDWGSRRPFVLLVEDDKVCRKIGAKFLQNLGCNVVTASDGLEAVGEVNNHPDPKFDMVFMDIIMPKLDGVSATACIREPLGDSPIIAMTSNIRHEDVSCYYQHGINDVLAKPFTRDGMLKMLKKHLKHLLRHTADTGSMNGGEFPGMIGNNRMSVATINAPMNPSMSAASPIVAAPPLSGIGATPPIPSPATSATASASWQSPVMIAHASPRAAPTETGYVVNSGPQILMTSGTSQPPAFLPHMAPSPAGRNPDLPMPGMDTRPEKRQRLYDTHVAFA